MVVKYIYSCKIFNFASCKTENNNKLYSTIKNQFVVDATKKLLQM